LFSFPLEPISKFTTGNVKNQAKADFFPTFIPVAAGFRNDGLKNRAGGVKLSPDPYIARKKHHHKGSRSI